VDDFGEGETKGISERLHLKAHLSGLPFVLGLLSDWVSFHRDASWLESPNLKSIQIINATEREQRFFTCFDGQGCVANQSGNTGL
jgi:hypothetical protein